jgi:hypothetical protein
MPAGLGHGKLVRPVCVEQGEVDVPEDEERMVVHGILSPPYFE